MYFDKIIGQSFAKKYITNSIRNNRISHAYMFNGIEGIGKLDFTREFCKILLNTQDLSNSPDYIEIKPDGNSVKIAQIRKLQSEIIIKPHKEYKIYIIEDSHKMTVEAQNALLKTLEEPPKYAIIILITSNKDILLDTIKSRCEIIKFLPIPIVEMTEYLERKGIQESRARLISTFSRGSVKIANELAESQEFFNMREDVENYINTIAEANIVEILNKINDIEKYRDNIVELLDITSNYFRDIMIYKEKLDKSMIINGDRMTFIQNMNKKITYSQSSKIIDIIDSTKRKLKSNCNFNISIQVMTLNIYEVIK